MATQAQTEANQQNSMHSTGPRTEEGKAASSQNARTHGLTGAWLPVAVLESDVFQEFKTKLAAELRPVGFLEELIADQILFAQWNMRRCRMLQFDDYDPHLEQDPYQWDPNEFRMQRYERYYRRNERSFYHALHELRKMQTDRYAAELLDAIDVRPEAAQSRPPLIEPHRVLHMRKQLAAGVRPTVSSPLIQ